MTDLKARVILTAVDNASGVMSKMFKKIDKAGKVMAANGTALRSAGMKMTAAFTLPAVGAVRSAADFEQALLEWKKAADEMGTTKGFAAARAAIDRLSGVLPQSHRDIAQMATQASKAGIAFKDVEKFVSLSAKAAAAFDIEAKESGEALAGIKQGGHLSMEKLQLLLGQMDLLENKFKTTGAHLIEIVSEEGAAGRKAGFTNEQFIAMAATMENAGIGSDKVARSLRRLSLDMTAGSQATKAQKDAWKLMGQDAVKMAKMMQGDPMKALRLLKVGLEKLPKHEQLATLKALFSSIGASNIGNLLDSFDTLDEALKTVGDYQAAMAQLDKSFAIGMAGLWPKLYLLRNAVMSNVFAMADVWWPKIKKVTDGLTEWSKAMRADPELAKRTAKAFGALAIAGPGLIVAGTALRAMGTALQFVSKVMRMSPAGLTLTALGASIYAVTKNWDKVEPSWNRLATSGERLWSSLDKLGTAAGIDFGSMFKNWDVEAATGIAWTMDKIAASLEAINRVAEAFQKRGWGGGLGQLWSENERAGAAIVSGATKMVTGRRRSLSERLLTAAGSAMAAPMDGASSGSGSGGPSVPVFPRRFPSQAAPQSAHGPLLRDLDGIEAVVKKPINVTGQVDANVKGHATVNVQVEVTGPGQVVGMSATSSGHIRADVGSRGVSMSDTGVAP